MKLTATTLNGVQYLEPVDIHDYIEKETYPADIPGLKNGDILDSEDCDLVWQIWSADGRWVRCAENPLVPGKTRQAYILKSQPERESDNDFYCGDFHHQPNATPGFKCDTQCDTCKDASVPQPSLNEGKEEEVINDIFSHIMEGAKKSPFVQAAKIIDEYVNGCCMDVPRRIGQDILKELYDQGYTLTKQP